MSLRLIARDLYRLHQQVERLQNELAAAPPARREALKRKLRQVEIERDQVKRRLDGRQDH
jgi:hypothetical protein